MDKNTCPVFVQSFLDVFQPLFLPSSIGLADILVLLQRLAHVNKRVERDLHVGEPSCCQEDVY